jgi:nitric oxide reductase large subunit
VPPDLLFLAVIWLVRSIVKTTLGTDESEGDPFISPNVNRLRAIGIILMIAPVVGTWAAMAEEALFQREFAMGALTYMEFEAGAMFTYFGVGILFLVVAEVFKMGLRLREDTEGLV